MSAIKQRKRLKQKKSNAAKYALSWKAAVAEAVEIDQDQRVFWRDFCAPKLLAEFKSYEELVARKAELYPTVRGVVIKSFGRTGALAELSQVSQLCCLFFGVAWAGSMWRGR
jgi:hypothetical protein